MGRRAVSEVRARVLSVSSWAGPLRQRATQCILFTHIVYSRSAYRVAGLIIGREDKLKEAGTMEYFTLAA